MVCDCSRQAHLLASPNVDASAQGRPCILANHATAPHSLRDLRVAEVTKMDMKVDNGKVTAFRTHVALSFKYEVE